MRHDPWAPWNLLAFDQDHVLGRKQARGLGLTEDAWQWKLEDGLWRPVLPGVVTTHSGPASLNQELWAAVLRVAPDSAVTGDAALVLAGFPMDDLRFVDVARRGQAGTTWRLPSGRLIRPMQVVQLRRHLAVSSGVPRLRNEIAVLHAAELAPSLRAAEWRLATTVQQGLAQVAGIRSALDLVTGLGRESLILRTLDDVEFGATAMSELDFLNVCRAHRLPEPDVMQVRVRAGGKTRFLDGLYRRQRVRFEVHGAHHRWVENWESDLTRGNELAVAARGSDEVCLTFSGRQVRHEGELVARLLRPLL